jgi:hypothetical protein
MCLYELARRFAEVVLDDADAHPRISFAPVASVVSLDSLSSVAQAATAAQSAASTNQNAGSAPTWAPQLVPVAEEEHKNLGPPNDENVMTRGLINLEQFLQVRWFFPFQSTRKMKILKGRLHNFFRFWIGLRGSKYSLALKSFACFSAHRKREQ